MGCPSARRQSSLVGTFSVVFLSILSPMMVQALLSSSPYASRSPIVEISEFSRVLSSFEQSPRNFFITELRSSFYDDDEDDDDEDEDEDEDDEYEDFDVSVEDFRSKMSSMFGESSSSDDDESDLMASDLEDDVGVDELIQFARNRAAGDDDSENQNNGDWAKKVNRIKPGTVLCANPQFFLTDFSSTNPDPRLLAKFGLTLPPPADLGADRRADLLPVLMVVEYEDDSDKKKESSGGSGKGLGDNNPFSFLGGGNSNSKKGTTAILLNRRTGYLLGDLEPGNGGMGGSGGEGNESAASATPTPLLEKFCIQPLWFGGVDNLSPGLEMLHQCPAVTGAIPLTEDGLFWGGEPTQAQEAMDASPDQQFTGFDFKFFVQATQFGPGQLEEQIEKGIWHTALVSKKVLFKSRDRMGTQRAKPLWTEIMELLGEDCLTLKKKLYNE